MDDDSGLLACGCYALFFIGLFILGGIASNYLISVLFHANIPFFFDGVIGALIGEVLIPITLIVWILKYFKVI